MRHPVVTVLTSGIGLGVYIPALLVRQQLMALGMLADVEVLESYYTDARLQQQLAHQRACYERFELALVAHRMARPIDDSLDSTRIDGLLQRWADERRRQFIVWSGFWLPVLTRYRALVDGPLDIDCCRIDAEVSASFRVYGALPADAHEIWLWNGSEKRTVYEIPVDDRRPLDFAERDDRLVVHGGGWGLGTYRERRVELAQTTWRCDAVVHDAHEAGPAHDRTFMVDPSWRPWHRNGEGHTFPPFAEVGRMWRGDEHALFGLIRRAKAIVSKPGGGTLIDSLASATPVVLLEPYGYGEAANGALWQHLGFGIAYDEWRASGFDPAILQRLHENLRRRRPGPSYTRAYVARRLEGARA
jgi:hypothetical protein